MSGHTGAADLGELGGSQVWAVRLCFDGFMRPWRPPLVGLVAVFAVLAGCGSDKEPTEGLPSSGAVADSKLLAARDLPKGFPVEEVPVIAGRVVRMRTGEAAGAPPGKKAWAVEVELEGNADDCFEAAVGALRSKGIRENQSLGDKALGRQSIFRSTHYNVIVSAIEISGDCTLWYAVGPDGLRLAG